MVLFLLYKKECTKVIFYSTNIIFFSRKNNLRSDEILLDVGDFKRGNNRAYYSIFHGRPIDIIKDVADIGYRLSLSASVPNELKN